MDMPGSLFEQCMHGRDIGTRLRASLDIKVCKDCRNESTKGASLGVLLQNCALNRIDYLRLAKYMT